MKQRSLSKAEIISRASAKRAGCTFATRPKSKAEQFAKRVDRFVKRSRKSQDFTPRLRQK